MNELRTLIETNFANSDKCFGTRIDAIRSLTPSASLLEIGSSWGYFLWQFNKAGGHAVGIEISDHRRAFGVNSLKLEIARNFEALGKTCFDVIYTAHTLEHFTDLKSIFPAIYNHLVPNGVLIVEVPNFAFKTEGTDALSIIGAVHPVGFSRAFFETALPRYGFKSVGFFDTWDCFPHSPTYSQGKEPDTVICLARKA